MDVYMLNETLKRKLILYLERQPYEEVAILITTLLDLPLVLGENDGN